MTQDGAPTRAEYFEAKQSEPETVGNGHLAYSPEAIERKIDETTETTSWEYEDTLSELNINTYFFETLDQKTEFDEAAKQCFSDLSKDGDLIKDDDFLERLSSLHPTIRMQLLARVTSHTYIGASDLEAYFERYPDDAKLVTFAVTRHLGFGKNPEAILFRLGSKALYQAAQMIPNHQGNYLEFVQGQLSSDDWNQGGWESPGIIDKYLQIGERSNLAREALIGDYKNNFSATYFDRFGLKISDQVRKMFNWADELFSGMKWGYLHPEQFIGQEVIDNLPPSDVHDFCIALIEHAHNMAVFHEVYNTIFDSQSSKPRNITGMGGRKIGRGRHSIIFRTAHPSQIYALDKFSDSPEKNVINSSEYQNTPHGK